MKIEQAKVGMRVIHKGKVWEVRELLETMRGTTRLDLVRTLNDGTTSSTDAKPEECEEI